MVLRTERLSISPSMKLFVLEKVLDDVNSIVVRSMVTNWRSLLVVPVSVAMISSS